MKKTIALAFCFIGCVLMAAPAAVPEEVENKAFDATKVPVMEEAPLDLVAADADWKKASGRKPRACGHGAVWKLESGSLIEGTATKEKNVPVKGKFTRYLAYASEKGKMLQGSGALDLSSWDSGVAPRDIRVVKYVFAVEKPGRTVMPFEFKIENWTPTESSWESPMNMSFSFRGIPVKLAMKAKISNESGKLKVVSEEPGKFTFLTAAAMGEFQTLMSLCNHQFLGSYVGLTFEAVFKKQCD